MWGGEGGQNGGFDLHFFLQNLETLGANLAGGGIWGEDLGVGGRLVFLRFFFF